MGLRLTFAVIAASVAALASAQPQQESAQPAASATRSSALYRLGFQSPRTGSLFLSRRGDDTRVSPNIDNLAPGDAVKKILSAIGREAVVDPDVPSEPRITLRASNVKLGSALDLISQAAGVGWSIERRDGKDVYHLGKRVGATPYDTLSARQSPAVELLLGNALRAPSTDTLKLNPAEARIYTYALTEDRSTFTCPHCKGTSTIVQQRQQPKCPKCGRQFQSDWQFCPVDGSQRPAAPGAWKYCPLCGKPVDSESAATR